MKLYFFQDNPFKIWLEMRIFLLFLQFITVGFHMLQKEVGLKKVVMIQCLWSFSDKPVQYRQPWYGYTERTESLISPDPLVRSSVWWCGMRNSRSNHFAALSACVPEELNGHLVWKERLTLSYVRTCMIKIGGTVTERPLNITNR